MGERRAGLASDVWVFLLLVAVFTVALNVPVVKGSGTIYIRADGSIDPPTAPVQRAADTYSFSDDISDSIVVERSNIIIDGSGYTLRGSAPETGFSLRSITNVTVKNTSIKGFWTGILLGASSNNSIYRNVVEGNEYGVIIDSSSYNTIFGNNITESHYFGMWLAWSSNNVLRNNSLTNNKYGFGIHGDVLSEFSNDVDPSNTVNGKPIYYWISKQDMTVPADAGYVALINCTTMTAQNLNVDHNLEGINLAFTTNSTITKCNITNNNHGLLIYHSSNNIISENKIAASGVNGFFVELSNYNNISGNTVKTNYHGIMLYRSSNNVICHNNFIGNPIQVDVLAGWGEVDVWDDGYPSGGNYWSDYTVRYPSGRELDDSGIWDTPYIIDENNRDRYPLMIPWGDIVPPFTSDNYDKSWHNADFSITLTANDDLTGVAEIYYRINNLLIKRVSTDGQPRISTESANNTLEYWSVDKAGNEESHHTLTGIKLDKTAPGGSLMINNGTAYTPSARVMLALTASDATSGVYQVRYSNDGVWDTAPPPWQTPSTTKAWTLNSGDGEKTVYCQIKDNAQLIAAFSDTIVLDTTPPTGSITINDNASYTNSLSVVLSLSACDVTSGVAQMRFSNDKMTWSDWEAYATSKSWTLLIGDGLRDVTVQYRDNAGSISFYRDFILLDTTKPVANAGQNQNVSVGATVTFDASGSTDNMGIVSYEWNFGDGTARTGFSTSHAYAASDTYTVTLTVEDLAGNTASDSSTVTVRSAEAHPPPPPAEPFPTWIIGGAIVATGIAFAVALLWKQRKQT